MKADTHAWTAHNGPSNSLKFSDYINIWEVWMGSVCPGSPAQQEFSHILYMNMSHALHTTIINSTVALCVATCAESVSSFLAAGASPPQNLVGARGCAPALRTQRAHTE